MNPWLSRIFTVISSRLFNEKRMSSTFSQLYVHIAFAVRGMKPLISKGNEQGVYLFMVRVAEEMGHSVLIINGTSNHVHLLVLLHPASAVADLVREIKRQSSFFINHKLPSKHYFNWDEGYSAFSHSRSHVNSVYKFIEKQKEYHQNVNFREEYLEMEHLREDDVEDDSLFKLKYP